MPRTLYSLGPRNSQEQIISKQHQLPTGLKIGNSAHSSEEHSRTLVPKLDENRTRTQSSRCAEGRDTRWTRAAEVSVPEPQLHPQPSCNSAVQPGRFEPGKPPFGWSQFLLETPSRNQEFLTSSPFHPPTCHIQPLQ